jgi:hypothetical protein
MSKSECDNVSAITLLERPISNVDQPLILPVGPTRFFIKELDRKLRINRLNERGIPW